MIGLIIGAVLCLVSFLSGYAVRAVTHVDDFGALLSELRMFSNEAGARFRYALSAADIELQSPFRLSSDGAGSEMKFDEHHETLFQIWRDDRGCE